MRYVTPVVIPILLFLAVRLQFIDFIPRWDSSEYFQALVNSFSKFNFTPSSFSSSFSWFNHHTIAFGFLSYLIQSFDKTNLYLLHLNMISLSLVAIFSFYYLCNKLFGKANRSENIILTCLFAVHPIFVSNSLYYSPDFGSLVFIIATISSFVNQKSFLTFTSSLILVFTKEVGVLMLGAFIGSFSLLTKFKELKRTLLLVVPIIIYVLHRTFGNITNWNPDGNNLLTFANDCRFCFGVKFFNIYQYLSVFFVLNFNWILTSVMIVGLILKIKNKQKDLIDKNISLSICASILATILFFMFFIIYIYARYSSPYLGLFIFVFGYLLKYLITNKQMRIKFLTIVTTIMLFQTFNNFDFLSSQIFPTYKFGKHEMLKIGTEYLGDGLVYNTEFIYIQRILDKFLKDYEIKNTDSIFIDPYAWGTFYSGWGNFKDSQPKIYWRLENIDSLPKHMYYLSFPLVIYDEREIKKIEKGYVPESYDRNYILNKFDSKYDVKYLSQININGYSVNVYDLSSKSR